MYSPGPILSPRIVIRMISAENEPRSTTHTQTPGVLASIAALAQGVLCSGLPAGAQTDPFALVLTTWECGMTRWSLILGRKARFSKHPAVSLGRMAPAALAYNHTA